MATEDRLERLRKKAADLPMRPGIYMMRDKNGTIIYVGKSKVLRQRVSQYFFERADHSPKTKRMAAGVDDFETILVDSEIEALSLENSLIKLHQPKYNIKLKDDKSYPYIRVTQNADYPSMSVTRQRKNDGARYYGPYSGINIAYDIMRTAERVFRVASCKREFPRDIGRERPCLYSQLGRCCAPCAGNVTSEEYRDTYRQIAAFLRGDHAKITAELEEKMNAAAENLQFEIAAMYRDRIAALGKTGEKQKVVGSASLDQDVINLYADDACSCLAVMNVRAGRVVDNTNFIFPAEQIADCGAITAFLTDYYLKREYIPHELLLGIDLDADGENEDNEAALSAFLDSQAGRRVYIRHPERGDNKALVAMVYDNARQYAAEYQLQTERESDTLINLARLLRLEVVPERIECWDISNMGSENVTAGMIVAIEGRLAKSEYRYFRIGENGGRLDRPDDYASMREAVSRRMKRGGDMPDLILLDGGRGHVSTIRGLLDDMGIDIPVFGMVKDDFHKTRALTTDEDEISIAREQSVFQFIYKLQEEVHRFTISRMSDAKRKSVKTSSLTRIDGIGPSKAKTLLAHFGSIARLREASEDDIAAVKGISKANAAAVREYFDKKQ